MVAPAAAAMPMVVIGAAAGRKVERAFVAVADAADAADALEVAAIGALEAVAVAAVAAAVAMVKEADSWAALVSAVMAVWGLAAVLEAAVGKQAAEVVVAHRLAIAPA